MLAATAAVLLAATDASHAQRGAAPTVRTKRLLEPVPERVAPDRSAIGRADLLDAALRPAIMLVGYWPPSNEALRRFSADPVQNPSGWIGRNWERRGYDVYAFFPEFSPPNCSICGKGNGDFEVDYQDTVADFWSITAEVRPIAIITFSRGFLDLSWELEMNQYNRTFWFPDYVFPNSPTPVPPDEGVPPGHLRRSALPVEEIVAAVDVAHLGLDAMVCYSGDGGGFLSEFLAYHGVWYRRRHSDPSDPAWCVAAGHVHVGGQIDWERARRAAEVTLRTVAQYVDGVLDPSCRMSVPYCDTSTNSAGRGAYLSSTGSQSIAADRLTLVTSYLPPNETGFVFYGNGRTEVPFGNGTLCVSARHFRVLPLVQSDGDGTAYVPLDFDAPPMNGGPGAITPGSTWNFQYWTRDPNAGGLEYNASNGLELTFCP